MNQSTTQKKYGIRMTLPPDDPMRAPHLLGDAWESFKWFASERERDRAMAELQNKHPYYRVGDYPSLVLAKVER